LITRTALFHVFTASIASSAESSAWDISVRVSAAGPIGVLPSRSPVRDEDRGAATPVDCVFSRLEWRSAPLSAALASRLAVSGLVSAAVAGEEPTSGDMAIVKERVTSSDEFLVCPSTLPKTISSSTCRTLSQTHV
jgi:hypothetical protein